MSSPKTASTGPRRRLRAECLPVGNRPLRCLAAGLTLAAACLAIAAATPAFAKGSVKPGRPTGLIAVPGNASATLWWTAPAPNGGPSVTGYEVTVGTQSCTTSGATTCSVTGLANGHRYSVRVRASNRYGHGKDSHAVKVKPTSVPCTYIGPHADFRNCDLAGAELEQRNLVEADFTDANLTGANLASSYLTGADFTDADLSGTDLEQALMTGVTLTGADMAGSDLAGVYANAIVGAPSALPSGWELQRGCLIGQGANLSNDELAGVNVSGLNFSHSNLYDTDFTGANLTGANLSLSNMSGTNLTSSDLDGANLSGSVAGSSLFTDASLTGANLSETTMDTATLTGVSSGGIVVMPPTAVPALPYPWALANGYLVGPTANLANADLSDADLVGDVLTDTNLSGADLSGASLVGVIFNGPSGTLSGGIVGTPSALPSGWILIGGYLAGPGANLSGADLASLDLSGLDLAGADLNDANLSGTDLSGTTLSSVFSGGIVGVPSALPPAWTLTVGVLVGPGANLTSTSVIDGDLAGVDLTGADLTNAGLDATDVSGTDFTDADLEGVSSAELSGTPSALPPDYTVIGGYLLGPDVSLYGEELGGDNLSGVDLTGATLDSSVFTDANLTDANLTNADLIFATMTGAILTGVSWSNTICPDGTNSDNDGDTCTNNLG